MIVQFQRFLRLLQRLLGLRPLAGFLFQLAVGAAELPEFVRQQRDFARACRRQGVRGADIELAGHNHFSVLETLESRDAALFPALRRMIETGSVL